MEFRAINVAEFNRVVVVGVLMTMLGLAAAGCGGAAAPSDGVAGQNAEKFALDDAARVESVTEITAEPEAEPVDLDGRALYLSNCAACHGLSGEGQDGWQQRNPDGSFRAPAHDSTGHTWHHPDGLLFRIVRDGGLPGIGVKSGMPAFGDQLSDDQIVAVIDYLRDLWGPEERGFQAEVTANTGDRFP